MSTTYTPDTTKKRSDLEFFSLETFSITSPAVAKAAKLPDGKMAVIEANTPITLTEAGDSVCKGSKYQIGMRNDRDAVVIFSAVEANPSGPRYVRTSIKIGSICMADQRVIKEAKESLFREAKPASETPAKKESERKLQKVKDRGRDAFTGMPDMQ